MNNTLTTGILLLQHLATTSKPYGVTELAEQMKLPKSHVHRLLQTLLDAKYVEKDCRKYKIGIGALRLGHALLYDMPVRRIALPLMQSKALETHLQLTLALPFGHDALAVATISPNGKEDNPSVSIGAELKAGFSASGKLFCSYKSKEEQTKIAKTIDWTTGGPNAAKNEKDWVKKLNMITKQGYSINDKEASIDIVSMAVPIFYDDDHPVAALGTSHIRKDCPPKSWNSIIEQLKDTANQITLHLQK